MQRSERLRDYIQSNQHKQFCFSVHDCGLFATRWVDAELETDYTRKVELSVRRTGLRCALSAIKQSGGYKKIVQEVTGATPRVGPGWSTGDVAVFMQEGNIETLGVLATRLVHVPGKIGLTSFDASRVICWWSLECLAR